MIDPFCWILCLISSRFRLLATLLWKSMVVDLVGPEDFTAQSVDPTHLNIFFFANFKKITEGSENYC